MYLYVGYPRAAPPAHPISVPKKLAQRYYRLRTVLLTLAGTPTQWHICLRKYVKRGLSNSRIGLLKEALQSSLQGKEDVAANAPRGIDLALESLLYDQVSTLFMKVGGIKVWYAYFRSFTCDERVKDHAFELPTSTIGEIAIDTAKITGYGTVHV